MRGKEMKLRITAVRPFLVLAISIILYSCGPSLEDQLGELVRAKDTWIASAGSRQYSYRLEIGQRPPYTVSVANPGTLRDDWLENPPCSEIGVCRVDPTMRELFQFVLELIDTHRQSGGELRVVYDETLGFPKQIFWDDRNSFHSAGHILVSDVDFVDLDEDENCEQVRAIALMPMKGDGDDAAYLALLDQGANALPGLVSCMSDQSVMPDPRQAPVYAGSTVGDVAFWTFVRITGVHIEDFLPPEHKHKWEENGIYAYFEYVATPENRLTLQARASEWLNANEKN